MKAVVLDPSVSAAWVMPDDINPVAQRLYVQASEPNDLFHAPLLWHWEMGSILAMGVARGRIDGGQVERALELLDAARITFDGPPTLHRRMQIARLAQAHALPYHDASYLELVLRLNGQLASFDKKLIAAAKACGIACLSF